MDDSTPMPFGKHKGTPMGEVPDDYLYWLHGQEGIFGELREYLDDNIDAITENMNKNRYYNKY